MRVVFVCLLLLLTAWSGVSAGESKRLSFEHDRVHAHPWGLTYAQSGGGRKGRWIVQPEAGAPDGDAVLAQLDDDAAPDRVLLALVEGVTAEDVRAAVQCRPDGGRLKQTCGLAVRYQNPYSYYVAVADAEDESVRMYRVIDGSRQRIASWSGSIVEGLWHELRVEMRGLNAQVWWDGSRVIEVLDRAIQKDGRVGLWVSGDSTARFDALEIESFDEEEE